MTPEEILALAQEHEVEFVDLRYTPALGGCKHVTIPVAELQPGLFRDGYSCGGNSSECPRRLVPVPQTAFLDPFYQHPTLSLICDITDPATGADDPQDARAVARRAHACLGPAAPADRAQLAADLQFFVFDQACYEQTMNAAHYRVDSREGVWRRGGNEADNLGTQLRAGEGAGPLPPADSLHNLRSEMLAALAACGVECGAHQHGVATGGQMQIALGPAPLIQFADRLMICKYVIRNVAARHGKVATFMPQPLYGECGSGLPIRLALWQGEQPVLRGAVGGWRQHGASLLALICPTTNSYKRLGAGVGMPALPTCVPPGGRDDERSVWTAWRAPDPSCNPYLASSALLLAALDGTASDPASNSRDETKPDRFPVLLEEALQALEMDHQYLLRGDVYSEALLRQWVRHKLQHEVYPLRQRPQPYEFCLYFDV